MVDGPYVYAFEEVPEDLPRPPLAALRALQSMGYLVSPRGWRELPVDVRQTIAREGARDAVGSAVLDAAIRRISLQQVKMMPSAREPKRDQVPTTLLAALGPLRPVAVEQWRSLRALDRRVLSLLVRNARLLGRAMDEMLPSAPASADARGAAAAVARCEIAVRADVLPKVLGMDVQGGRAFVLARVAGRRAARRVAELLDVQADSTVGAIELDWGLRESDSVIFWQAHVSAWDGSFFPAAALLAATTAAVALHDMIKDLDPGATLGAGRVREEPWEAGREEAPEPATGLFQNPRPTADPARRAPFDATVVTGPPSLDPVEYPSLQPSSAPRYSQPAPPGPPSPRVAESGGRALAPAPAAPLDRATGPSSRLFYVVSVIAVTAVLGLIGLALGLARAGGRL